jgi:hypothetical protein
MLRTFAATSDETQPLTLGVPFATAQLTHAGTARLVDATGRETNCQIHPLAHWSDGSIKWLLVDAVLSRWPAGENSCELRVDSCSRQGDGARSPNGRPLTCVELGDHSIVDTGTIRFRIAGARSEVSVNDESGGPNSDSWTIGMVFRDRRGRRREIHVERSTVETRGPLRTTVLLEGVVRRARGLRFRCRLCFFAGTGLMRIRFTLHNSNRARHRGGLWDLGDAGSMLFRELSLEVCSRVSQTRAIWTAEPDQSPQRADDACVAIYQDSSGGENWHSPNHVNRDGRVPCRRRGYEVRTALSTTSGLRASPTMSMVAGERAVAAVIPGFWQNFPKLLVAEPGVLRMGLFPEEWDDLHELQGGEQKTHTVWLRFGNAEETTVGSLAWVHRPPRAAADPRWIASSGAVTPFITADESPDEQLPTLRQGAIHGDESLLARRETIDEYGWRHYGETYADHENAYYTGVKPVVSHYNNQYDLLYGALLAWLGTGKPAWLDLAEPLARHVIDIDMYRTSRDRSCYAGGLFWHTDHYLDAASATHRSFSRTNLPGDGRAYGGGPTNEHNYATGLLHFHYLTGDPDALRTVIDLADWVVRMDDGHRNVLGLIDEGSTGWATMGDDFGESVPARGPANSINVLLDGWLATGQRRYLDLAEVFIRRVIHPNDDIEGRGLLNFEYCWSYTLFLSALARYLDVKSEAGELDSMYAYAQAVLLRYAEWMERHERPYFDRPEEMQFPTETWAAQELRKANVLRLASRHATGATRAALLRRGDELAERAWADWSRFSTRFATRPVAILLTEGVRDASFRSSTPPAECTRRPWAGQSSPEQFVPQKRKVFEQLRTAGGVAGALACMFNPKTYVRLALLVLRGQLR